MPPAGERERQACVNRAVARSAIAQGQRSGCFMPSAASCAALYGPLTPGGAAPATVAVQASSASAPGPPAGAEAAPAAVGGGEGDLCEPWQSQVDGCDAFDAEAEAARALGNL